MICTKIEVWLGLVLLCAAPRLLTAQEIADTTVMPEETAQERFLISKLEEEALAYAEKTGPEEMVKLQELKSQDPARFYREIFMVLDNHRKLSQAEYRALMERATMLRLREMDMARYELAVNKKRLERQSQELVAAFKKASDERTRSEVHAKLVQAISELFDLREHERQSYVKHLEERLAELRKALAERRQNRDRIIENRVSELLSDTQNAEW